MQALNFNIKSLECSVNSEYVEVKNCSIKSLEHATYDMNLNIVFIKEVAKLQVKSDRNQISNKLNRKLAGVYPDILQIFENQPTYYN